jgi:hypothetical protein
MRHLRLATSAAGVTLCLQARSFIAVSLRLIMKSAINWLWTATASLVAVLAFPACRQQPAAPPAQNPPPAFNPALLKVQDNQRINKARGQLLYLPVYSNIPFLEGMKKYDLAGILAIHNTDLERTITVSQVLFFNNDGHLVKDHLAQRSITLRPLQAANFFVPESDKSGTGANFLVEWHAASPVNTPLVEMVMLSMSGGSGVSFSSSGKVIREDH